MKVLVTGAFGNLGERVVRELQRQALAVRCADLPNARNRRAAGAHAGRVELAWGDVRDAPWLERQLADVDAVIHLAALLPPATEKQPALAWLENAYVERNRGLPFIKCDLAFDKLRDDPHFQDLLRRMNLPEK